MLHIGCLEYQVSYSSQCAKSKGKTRITSGYRLSLLVMIGWERISRGKANLTMCQDIC